MAAQSRRFILSTMLAGRCALVVAVALLVGSCSGGGTPMVDVPHVVGTTQALAVEELTAKHLIPIVRFVNSANKEPGTVVAQNPMASARVLRTTKVVISVVSAIPQHPIVATPAPAGLGPCPPKYPRASPEAVNNVGVDGLGSKLIPIEVRRVRFCRYNGEDLKDAGLPGTEVAVHIADEVARLHVVRTVNYCSGGTSGAGKPANSRPLSVFLTFASDTQQVTVLAGDCGALTNGVVSVTLTPNLVEELRTLGSGPA